LWKEADARISRRVVDQTVAACILRNDLFERRGKNPSGRTVAYLSRYPQPQVDLEPERIVKMNLEVEGEVEGLEVEGLEGSVKNELPLLKCPKSFKEGEVEGTICKKDPFRFVSARNCGIVEVEKNVPYGEAFEPSTSIGSMPPFPKEDANAEYF